MAQKDYGAARGEPLSLDWQCVHCGREATVKAVRNSFGKKFEVLYCAEHHDEEAGKRGVESRRKVIGSVLVILAATATFSSVMLALDIPDYVEEQGIEGWEFIPMLGVVGVGAVALGLWIGGGRNVDARMAAEAIST